MNGHLSFMLVQSAKDQWDAVEQIIRFLPVSYSVVFPSWL
jgi:hypothetical protein